jgi:phosphomannomutase/phosphoglucomutase
VAQAATHFAARYPVQTIDGVRITYPDGWGLVRASNTQPILVLRFEGATPAARDAHHAEMTAWLRTQGIGV